MVDMRSDPLGFLGVRCGRSVGLLLRQGAGMDDHKSEVGLGDVAIRILDVHLAQDTLAAPASGGIVGGMPRFF